MKTQVYYIIRHKTTQQWIPASLQRGRTAVELSSELPPRLFSTKGAAKQSLKWWCDGISYMASETNWLGSNEYMLVTDKKPERKLEDMEVIAVELKEIYEIRNTTQDLSL